MLKTIIGLGGGGFTMDNNHFLDLYILASCAKKKPKICFLPTASGDNAGYSGHFKRVFAQYPCETSVLSVVSPDIEDMETFILSQDILYVGGGNTKSMLALWKEWGLNKILKKAYDAGIILAGVSAGFVCWFEECVTDSLPGKYSQLTCLGMLTGSACPHYNGQGGRPEAYQKMLAASEISEGYAVDDGVALHFENGRLLRTISSRRNCNAYALYREMNGKVTTDTVSPIFLGESDAFSKYIGQPLFGDAPDSSQEEEEIDVPVEKVITEE